MNLLGLPDWTVSVITFFVLLYLYATRKKNYWKNQNVVYEKLSLIFGPASRILFHPLHETDEKRYKKYGKLFGCTSHGTTGISPAVLLHGRQPRTRLDIIGLPSKDFFQRPEAEVKSLRKGVEDRQSKSKTYTDEKRGAKVAKLKQGDFVRVHKPPGGTKGDLRYATPLKILKRKGPGTFLLEERRKWNVSKLVVVPQAEKEEPGWPGWFPLNSKAPMEPHSVPSHQRPAQDEQLPELAVAEQRTPPGQKESTSVPLPASQQMPQPDNNVREPLTRSRKPPSWLRDYVT